MTKKTSPGKRIANTIFWLIVVALLTAGTYLIAKPYYSRWQRNRLTEQLNASYQQHLEAMKTATTPITEPAEPLLPSDTATSSHTDDSASPDLTPPPSSPTDSASPDPADPTQPDERAPDSDADYVYPTMVIDPNAHALPSEEEVWIRDHEVYQQAVQETPSGDVTLTIIGQMRIDKLDLLMPIIDNALHYTIRYGLGHYPDGKLFGEQGNTVIFGHRMRNYGEHLNRADELRQGDRIEVAYHGQIYVYEVSQQKIVETAQVYDEMFDHPADRSQLILATCHPIPTFEDYLLVYADLVEIR